MASRTDSTSRLSQVLYTPAPSGATGNTRRSFVLPENASKKKGPVSTTDPTISKAPYHDERNLLYEYII